MSTSLYHRLRQRMNPFGKEPTSNTDYLRDVPIISAAPHLPLEVHPDDPPERQELVDKVQSTYWYHTIELPYDVVTPGRFDHRPALDRFHLPEDLSGLHALDVATFDGFWAFEMERRGAASVTAIDVARLSQCDLPPMARADFLASGEDRETGAAFHIAHEARQSKVQRRILSVYELSPETIGRTFDFVFCGDLLIHLRDPNLALERIRSVTKDWALFTEAFDPLLGNVNDPQMQYRVTFLGGYNESCVWWLPSPTAWRSMIQGAGFQRVEQVGIFRVDHPDGTPGPWRVVHKAYV